MKETASLDWSYLAELLPAGRDALAAKHGIRFGTRHNAKLENIDQLLQLYLGHVAMGMSLITAAAVGEASGLPSMTGVALHLRARKLAPFLADLLSRMLALGKEFAAPRWAGYEIVIVDGTTGVRPGGDRISVRILYAMRLADLQLLDLQVGDDKLGETFRRLPCQPGQLFVGDRAYANPPGVAHVVEAGADVLVRYNWASMPLTDTRGNRFDIFSKLDKLGGGLREWKVFASHQGLSIPGRLVVEKLPAHEAKRARAKLQKDNPSASKRTVKTAGFRMIFSTVPRTRLSAQALMTLYVCRWQIELTIKRDKSIEDLDALPNFRDDTIASWIYAKLLLAQLTRRVLADARDLSPSGFGRTRAAG